MRVWWCVSVFAIGGLAGATPASAQDFTFGGQVRPRFEFRDPAIVGSDAFTTMRVRAQMRAEMDRGVSAFIQFQDVRFWGGETSTIDFSAEGLDLHQGYLKVRSSGPTVLSALFGRQEINFGGQRLVGALDWEQGARAFDGVRLGADGKIGRADFIGTQLTESGLPQDPDDAFLLGAYGTLLQTGPGDLDLYALYNAVEDEDSSETQQLTAGARWFGLYRSIAFRVESSYQTGTRLGADVRAFMVGARIGTELFAGSTSLTLWYDYLSGDSDSGDGTIRVFDTLFATNHKFYGLADYFLNIPIQTAGRGLQDLALKSRYKAHVDVTLAADLHSFHLAQSAGLTTGHLGEELDLTGVYRFSKHFKVVGGFSYLFVADGFGEIGRFTEDATWAYLMLDANF